ncbi:MULTISPECIES: hypothetical protein [Helicobacter]|uniref:hypothetical protein n=1 Tax=Helicobacter TaxID=209 RepID=UPI000DCD9C47|nr:MULTISPECIES: hypothetical protein [Helicobacter]MCI2235317.1 hypothetical protein [Helicobacter sp. CaF467b]MCI7047251.1 hypothetical protein [Helicobacter sp.]MCI7764957.1 hypothetical protein [Helicobacter sp.]MCL9823563.1 hypothetical protein [Helicobacter colisuis]MDY4426404.1 hypothetical protein [Helicobacter sp.]
MNINNPMHIKPKLVSNNLGTLETNGNFKLTEETIKESQEQARIAKEQERIRQARESTRARVLNVLGSNSIQSFGLKSSNSSLNGDKLNYFTPSFYSHSISYDEFGRTNFDNAYRWSGANGGGDMLNAAGKSQYLNTPVGEMQVFLDLDDDNDQYGVGSIEYMGQLINLDDNQDGFLDSSDEFFSKLKLKGYNSKGEEIILKFSDVYNSLDLTKFVNTQRDVEENIKKYGYNKGNLESGTSLFRPEESYKKLNDTQKDQIRKMFAENADESGWIDLTKTYKDEYRLERLTFEKLLKNLDFAYSKTDLNGGLKLERLRFSGYDGRDDRKYGKQESYLAGLQNRFNKMYHDYYNNEEADKLAIRREFQAITGLKFSEANFREFYNGLNSSSTAMKYASALKSVDSVVAMRLDDNGMMTLKFDSGRTMRLSLDELYTSNGDFNDLTERSERASAFSEAMSFDEEDLNKLDFNKIGADINMNGSITSLAELGVELIRKLSFQNGRSAFILTTGDGKELVANALHKIQNVENMIRFSELEEKDKLRGSKFEMEM